MHTPMAFYLEDTCVVNTFANSHLLVYADNWYQCQNHGRNIFLEIKWPFLCSLSNKILFCVQWWAICSWLKEKLWSGKIWVCFIGPTHMNSKCHVYMFQLENHSIILNWRIFCDIAQKKHFKWPVLTNGATKKICISNISHCITEFSNCKKKQRQCSKC